MIFWFRKRLAVKRLAAFLQEPSVLEPATTSMLKQHLAKRALEATLRPDPDSRTRRLSQWDSARRERYFEANAGLLRGQ